MRRARPTPLSLLLAGAASLCGCDGGAGPGEGPYDVARSALEVDRGGVAGDLPLVTQVGSAHTFRFRVTAGPRGIPEGAVLKVRVPGTFSDPQTWRPEDAGYSVAFGPDGARIPVSAWIDRVFEHLAGTEGRILRVALPGRIDPGGSVEIVYGETSGGGIGSRVSFLARDAFEFDVELDAEGDGSATLLATYRIRTLPEEPEEIKVYPAATARAGAPVNFRAAAFDRLGNPVEGVTGLVHCQWRRGSAIGPSSTLVLEPGTLPGDVASGAVTAPDRAGPWRLSCWHPELPITVEGATIVRPSPNAGYRMVGEGADAEPQLLWGDLHVHSNISRDAAGASLAPASLYLRARDTAGLDFASVSDHDRGGFNSDLSVWRDSAIAPTNLYYSPGSFVTLLSWEWTETMAHVGADEGGHKIVYYLQGDGSSYCEIDGDSCGGGTFDQPALLGNIGFGAAYETSCGLWEGLTAQAADPEASVQAIVVPHHIATLGNPTPTLWETVPDECGGSPSPGMGIQPLVEIYSDHGSSEGWIGGYDVIDDPVECTPDTGRTFQKALEDQWGDGADRPHYLGVIASGDSHFGRPGQDPLPIAGGNDASGATAGLGIKCADGSGDFRWREIGLAAVWVDGVDRPDALTRDGVFESLRRRRAYGTTGSRITLDYSLEDTLAGVTTVVDQGGAPRGGVPDYDQPLRLLSDLSDRSVRLRVKDVCAGSTGATLDRIDLVHGYADPADGMWGWTVRRSWTPGDLDAATGCLLDAAVDLVVAGEAVAEDLKEGRNVFYVKVKEANVEPIRVVSSRNKLRIQPSGGAAVTCTLTQGDWSAAAYVAQLEADLDACAMSPDLDFSVSMDDVMDRESDDYRLKISASGRFAMDNDANTNVKSTAAMLGFAQADHVGAREYLAVDQLQRYANAEFAWSSPIWIDYVP